MLCYISYVQNRTCYITCLMLCYITCVILCYMTYVQNRTCYITCVVTYVIAELWRAKRACGAPWVSKSTHTRKFGYHVTVHRPPAARPSAPQAYQCLLSHFLATLGAQEKADCTSMLSSIDSCQNRVSADQYHLTVLRAQVSTH